MFVTFKVDCGTPASPLHGSVLYNGTSYSKEAHFSCDLDYILKGPNVSVCDVSGLWEPSPPSCFLAGKIFLCFDVLIF